MTLVTCTLKIHAVIWHVREHCQDQILLNPEDPKGLGFCSTQTGESMHMHKTLFIHVGIMLRLYAINCTEQSQNGLHYA